MQLINKLTSLNKKSRALLPLLAIIGLLSAITIIKLQPGVSHQSQQQKAQAVDTIKLQTQLIKPSITGFGSVEPDKKLNLKAEVSGRINYLNPELKKGALLPKGSIVIKIDDVDYQLALKQAQADLLVNKANLSEFEVNIINTKQDLSLANKKLKIAKRDYQRKSKLQKKGTIAKSTLDQAHNQVLSYQQETQKLTNKLSTFAAQKEVLNAKIASSKAKVAQQQRNLARTTITLPFSGRIGEVSVEQDQYITAASPLFSFQGIEKVIINAQFSIDKFYIIAKSFDKQQKLLEQAIKTQQFNQVFQQLGLTATVLSTTNHHAKWQAKVERISDQMDAKSRTIGVVVSVSDSYKHVKPGSKPPLMEGMYMQVQLNASADNFIAAPRAALHENYLYLVDNNNKLARYQIKNPQLQGELVLLNDPALNGKQVVVSDLFPAVNNMLLAPQIDQHITKQMQRWVTGE